MSDDSEKLTLQPSCKNFYPNCVSLKLHVDSGESGAGKALENRRFLINLTIVFGEEQEIEFPGIFKSGFLKGKLTFGLRKGWLKLSLDGCCLPLENVHLEKPLKIFLEQEIEQEISGEAEIGASIIPTSNPDNSSRIGIKGSRKRVEKFRFDLFQIRKVGSEQMPTWIFEALPPEPTLQGSLKSKTLGEFIFLDKASRIEAVFCSRAEDIRITWGEIGSTKNISRNKIALIERAIAMKYLAQEINLDRMSEATWSHE